MAIEPESKKLASVAEVSERLYNKEVFDRIALLKNRKIHKKNKT